MGRTIIKHSFILWDFYVPSSKEMDIYYNYFIQQIIIYLKFELSFVIRFYLHETDIENVTFYLLECLNYSPSCLITLVLKVNVIGFAYQPQNLFHITSLQVQLI